MDFLNKLGIKDINSGVSIGHSWSSSRKDTIIDSFSPINGEVIAKVTTGNMADYEKVMQASEKAFYEWRDVPAPKRGEIIRQMGDALREHKDALGSLVSFEMGKSKQEGDGEVQEMIDIADFAVGQSRMLYGKTMHSERYHHRMYEQWHPYGVVGVISAFNFPVAVWAWNAFLAAICGNTVVWKPSSKTALCAVAVHQIMEKVLRDNQCPAIFSLIIPENHDIAESFINDKRVPLVSFTGSTKTGRHVSQVVGKRLGNSILELGGNNAIIVDETAELGLAIPAIVFGAVGTCGQRCTSTRRVFIHESRYDDVVTRLADAYKQVTIGNPLDVKNLMGPLIDEMAVETYLNAINEIKSQGGEIKFGGARIKQPGFYVEPTIVTGLENTAPIVQEETFAPILYLMKYKTLEEAINLQNGVMQGLSSAIFTQSLSNAEFFLSALGSDCGIANVNIGTSGAEIGGAFGGEKDTGGGRESGSDAWKGYMRRQTNTINWSPDLPLAQGIEFDIS
jgi:aldehyde dehydrogenase (NAD+)